jgi:hypothetical protein
MKAYDSVDWEFILHCLTCFGFLAKFTNWVKVCITSPRFSISLNGSLIGYFPGGKGLRQGDPLSLYLFVLATEVFTRIMDDHARKGSGFQFHFRCSRMRLTHLCFADDLLVTNLFFFNFFLFYIYIYIYTKHFININLLKYKWIFTVARRYVAKPTYGIYPIICTW